jgi:hypothetical protein
VSVVGATRGARVYERRFDHEEATRRRQEGVPVTQLADEYGVGTTAIYFATTPDRNPSRVARQRQWRLTQCSVCGGPAQKQTYRGDAPRCRSCAAAASATSVRGDTLHCCTCDRWLPDSAFPSDRRQRARRYRHRQCTACQTAARTAYRERKKVPCSRCGKPCLPKSEKAAAKNRAHLQDTGLCGACYRANREKKTHCVRGHERTPDNLNRWGQCCECKRARERKRYRRRRATA